MKRHQIYNHSNRLGIALSIADKTKALLLKIDAILNYFSIKMTSSILASQQLTSLFFALETIGLINCFIKKAAQAKEYTAKDALDFLTYFFIIFTIAINMSSFIALQRASLLILSAKKSISNIFKISELNDKSSTKNPKQKDNLIKALAITLLILFVMSNSLNLILVSNSSYFLIQTSLSTNYILATTIIALDLYNIITQSLARYQPSDDHQKRHSKVMLQLRLQHKRSPAKKEHAKKMSPILLQIKTHAQNSEEKQPNSPHQEEILVIGNVTPD